LNAAFSSTIFDLARCDLSMLNTLSLFFHPARSIKNLLTFATSFDFLVSDQEMYQALTEGYTVNMALANKPYPSRKNDTVVIQLPEKAWARRDSDVFSEELANNYPDRLDTTLTNNSDVNFLVSIRSTLNIKYD
jgi:hypothetical protein